jgi:signal transduction histidine kinase
VRHKNSRKEGDLETADKMIPIRKIMKNNFPKLSSSSSVGAAVNVMEKMGVDYLLVEEGDIKGVVTSRELAGYPSSRLILDCVIQPVDTISEGALADEALKVLEKGKVSFLVVLKNEYIPVGILNREIIIAFLFQELKELNREKDRLIRNLRKAEAALKTSRASFYNIVEKSADGIVVTDRNGVARFVNKTLEIILNRRAEELVSEMFGFPVISGGMAEIDIVRKSGEPGIGEMSVAETEWEGEPAYLVSLHDITELKQAMQAQERLSQQLQVKVSELEAFSYGIAHDLRSPMLSIDGFSRELRTDIQNQKMDRVEEDIRLIESGVRKMQQFLNRTLEYSRAGYQVKLTKDVPFGKIVKEVVAELNGQMSSIGATISVADTFPKVNVDRIRMVQVLTNLIQNSIKYRDKTRPLKIDLSYQLSGNEVVFYVRDNGTGIDASEAEKVFELFYRGTADGEGSGAGLAIVKRIIEAHGGRVWAEGESGNGTTVYFALPQKNGSDSGGNNEKD